MIDPSKGISLDDATAWFKAVWEHYTTEKFFSDYRRENGQEWADEDLKTLLRFLTLKNENNTRSTISGYKKIIPGRKLHTETVDKLYEDEILDYYGQAR